MRLSGFSTVNGGLPAWPAWVGAGHRRRVDPLTRVACAAVAGLEGSTTLPAETALVVATAYGAVESTWRFATSIADFGDAGASPTPFTASVHNSCAGALGELLHLHGPCTTLCQGGHATTAALRWADLMLHSGRAPMVLLVLADHHNAWSRPMINELTASPWPLGDGAVALLVEPGDGPGRELRWGDHAADLVISSGTPDPEDAAMLANARCSAELLNAWWPGCALAGVSAAEWRSPLTLQVRECEDRIVQSAWLGPWR